MTILVGIVVILTSIDPILEKCVHLQVQYLQVLFTSIVTILASIEQVNNPMTIISNIALAGEHIFQVLGQYSQVLQQYLQILSKFLRVLSR